LPPDQPLSACGITTKPGTLMLIGLTLTAALHTYFGVTDIGQTRVHGLAGGNYLDKVNGFARTRQASWSGTRGRSMTKPSPT
jgi:D-hexose-6-phosphate mutarotase